VAYYLLGLRAGFNSDNPTPPTPPKRLKDKYNKAEAILLLEQIASAQCGGFADVILSSLIYIVQVIFCKCKGGSEKKAKCGGSCERLF